MNLPNPKIFIPSVMAYCFIIGLVVFYANRDGRINAFEAIISEECWLNKTSRDIECIEHIQGDK